MLVNRIISPSKNNFMFIVLALTSFLTIAKDLHGESAIDGIGGLSCAKFIAAKDNKDVSYYQFGGWIEGYFSASNKYLENTYDLSPWQTTETLSTMLYTTCSKQSSISFANAVSSLSSQLQSFAAHKKSQIINMKQGKYTTSVSLSVLIQAQEKLKGLDLLKGESLGKYDISTTKALFAYQALKNLPKTGLPDQYTLWNLLLTN